ncbi:thioredoxin family protein [Nitrosophilus alvini]|uniref:thioredoxin family protein n=1 Tax=Nitrosophilus alvini TaxID=2714855 RepID=UPI00190E41C0|nr:thioredoxin family protein [Nitrosophilus alvini]
MKKLVSILFLSIVLFAADFDWVESLDKAKEMAKKTGKPIMLMIDQKGCEACEYMDEVVFETDNVAEFVENFFIPVKMEMKKAKAAGFKVFGTPTFYFFNSKGEKIGRQLVGAAPAKAFIHKLQVYKKLNEKYK